MRSLQQALCSATLGVIAPAHRHAYLGSVIEPVISLPRRDAGPPVRLGPCIAVLALLVAAAILLLSGPAPARVTGTGSAHAVTAVSSIAVPGTRTQMSKTSAAKAVRTVFDETSVSTAEVEAPAEFGLPIACAAPARSRLATEAAYPETRRTGPSSSAHGSPLRPPRAA